MNKLCRLCGAADFTEVIDFGAIAIANNLPRHPTESSSQKYPLKLIVCEKCRLAQIAQPVDKGLVFHEDYTYFASVSSTWLDHVHETIEKCLSLRKRHNRPTDFIIDIASNDGYLLQQFPKQKYKRLGIEPSSSVAEVSKQKDIDTVVDFFTEDLSKTLIETEGAPNLVFALNVIGHVPDPMDFFRGLKVMADAGAYVNIEIPYFKNLLEKHQFDTIYHEHYQYFFLSSIDYVTNLLHLDVIDFEFVATHGGSMRCVLASRRLGIGHSKFYQDALFDETNYLRASNENFERFRQLTEEAIARLDDILSNADQDGIVVCGYGAAAKTSTFLALSKSASPITCIFDKAPSKVGRYIPGTAVPIRHPSEILSVAPDKIIIFPGTSQGKLLMKLNRYLLPTILRHPN